MNEKRAEQFINWFGTSVQINDCDPALFIINYFFDRFEFNREQKYWLCWIYGTTYHFPATYIIWNEFPDMELVGLKRLKDWNDNNYKRLRYQVDTKWNKGHLPEQFLSYKEWVGQSSQHDKIQSLLSGNPIKDFDTLWKESKSWHKFGRYTAWFYLQTLKHCAGVNLSPQTLLLDDYEGSRSHRNGLCYALGEDNLLNIKLDEKKLLEFNESSEYLLRQTQKQYPKLKNKLDYFAMETCLCSFKKLFRTRDGRYMGYYLDRQAEEIKKVEQDNWIGINWNPLWQARKECIKEQYLAGYIDKEKMKLFLKANKSPSKNLSLTIIGGIAGTGKTTLMNNIRSKLGKCVKKESRLLRYEEYANHVILGIYDGTIFEGTDRLSMAVSNDALNFLEKNTKKVLIEGDRLFNLKFLNTAKEKGYDVKVVICYVFDMTKLLGRYKKRGQMQSPSFIKGRLTKIKNISREFPPHIVDTTSPLSNKIINSLIP